MDLWGGLVGTLVLMEPTLKYHPGVFEGVLTWNWYYLDRGQCMVATKFDYCRFPQSVTEEFEGSTLVTFGHRDDAIAYNA